jgi:hypothetical protein
MSIDILEMRVGIVREKRSQTPSKAPSAAAVSIAAALGLSAPAAASQKAVRVRASAEAQTNDWRAKKNVVPVAIVIGDFEKSTEQSRVDQSPSGALSLVQMVERVLPVNHEMDRLAAAAMRKRNAAAKTRKITK